MIGMVNTADSSIKIWSAKSKGEIVTIKHDITIDSVLWSPDGSKIAIINENLTKVWQIKDGTDVEDALKINYDDSKINIFPNPANSELNLKSEIPIISYEISDILGSKLLFQNDLLRLGSLPEININTSILNSGTYLLKVRTLYGLVYKKFIIE